MEYHNLGKLFSGKGYKQSHSLENTKLSEKTIKRNETKKEIKRQTELKRVSFGNQEPISTLSSHKNIQRQLKCVSSKAIEHSKCESQCEAQQLKKLRTVPPINSSLSKKRLEFSVDNKSLTPLPNVEKEPTLHGAKFQCKNDESVLAKERVVRRKDALPGLNVNMMGGKSLSEGASKDETTVKRPKCQLKRLSRQTRNAGVSEPSETLNIAGENQSVVHCKYEEENQFLSLCVSSLNHFLIMSQKKLSEDSGIFTKKDSFQKTEHHHCKALEADEFCKQDRKIKRRRSTKTKLPRLENNNDSTRDSNQKGKDFKFDELRAFVRDIMRSTRHVTGEEFRTNFQNKEEPQNCAKGLLETEKDPVKETHEKG